MLKTPERLNQGDAITAMIANINGNSSEPKLLQEGGN